MINRRAAAIHHMEIEQEVLQDDVKEDAGLFDWPVGLARGPRSCRFEGAKHPNKGLYIDMTRRPELMFLA